MTFSVVSKGSMRSVAKGGSSMTFENLPGLVRNAQAIHSNGEEDEGKDTGD